MLTVIFFITLYFFLNNQKLFTLSSGFIQKYSDKYDYNLIDINISNLDYINEDEIKNYFDKSIGKSIFLIQLKILVKNLHQIKWINTIDIKSNYKDTLNIMIKEEEPFGIYNINDQHILFSKNLVVLEILDQKHNFSELINYFGKGSVNNSTKFMLNFDINFKKKIKSVIFIEKRRWNNKMKNEILLKLPEFNIKKAINNYREIYANLSNKDLEEIESIDLRIKNKAIIRYKEIN